MTPKEKQLLLKDLCARLPYKLKVKCEKYPFPVTVLYAGDVNEVKFKETGGIEHIDMIKPYLRPMSSMTKEEEKELGNFVAAEMFASQNKDPLFQLTRKALFADFFNKRHIDYRGLIPMGLALEAPDGMYKTK